jgi:SAM-dependent methyltransferase
VEQGPEHRLLEPGAEQAELIAGADRPYEQVAYPGYVYPRTHPARLEVIARLFGVPAPPARTARVLEIGCGDGGNALAIAQTLPGAEILGFDLTPGPLQGGRDLAAEAGLGNVELRCADLLDEGAMSAIEEVDYVIAHGVYSWIPPAARGALLRLCGRCLSPHGIAFISFNAYPGSYLRDMARDILAYHLRDTTGATRRLAAAHELMETIVAVESPDPFARVLREHLQRMLDNGDALLYHDDLAEISTPFYLHEFMAHASAHGLQFMSDAELSDSQLYDVPEAVGELLASLPPDVVVREQYLDFFRNRMFRQTLLVRSQHEITRSIDDGPVAGMAVACDARRDDDAFVLSGGGRMTISHPFSHAALDELCDTWPATPMFAQLLERAAARLGLPGPPADGEVVLRELLLQAYVVQGVRLLGCPLPAGRPGPAPTASPLARAQAARGEPVLSTLLPGNHRVAGEDERALLGALDGTRDVTALAAHLGRDAATVSAEVERLATAGLLLAGA